MNTDEVWNYLAHCWEASGCEHWWDFAHESSLLADEELARMMSYFKDYVVYYAHGQRPEHMAPEDYRVAVEYLFRDWYEQIYLPYTQQEQQAAAAAYEQQTAGWGSQEEFYEETTLTWSEETAHSQGSWGSTTTEGPGETPAEPQPAVSAEEAAHASAVFEAFAGDSTDLPGDLIDVLERDAELGAEEVEDDVLPRFS